MTPFYLSISLNYGDYHQQVPGLVGAGKAHYTSLGEGRGAGMNPMDPLLALGCDLILVLFIQS